MGLLHLVAPLSRLFRSAPPAQPAAQDGAAALDTPSPAAMLELQDGEVLRRLAGLSGEASPPPDAGLERTAQQRMAQLLDAGAIEFGSLCATAENPSTLLTVAALSGNPSHLPQALASIGDPRKVAALVTEGSSSRIRQLAAQTIEDPAELKQLLRQLRGKDKSVYKIIKQKCDVLRAAEQQVARIEAEIATLCESLERHSRRIYDVLYAPSLRQFEAQWKTLESQAKPEARKRVQRGMDACREVIGAHERQLAEQAEEAAHRAALLAAREEARA
ncbi:MAG: hypothetical protein WBF89_20445, partial [Steroidobacteraceae bacterium]